MVTHYLLTGFGGALGAMSRVFLANILPASLYGIPIQILIINIFGCFLMGMLAELMTLHFLISDSLRYFLISGFLGGFTTFSTFALDFWILIEKDSIFVAIFYATLSVLLTLVCFFCGLKLIEILSP
ncbi:MAG: fluoride efflux transporter CrcB [Alphaproteobacteria bacterium]|nr:fluoride efflux transporter CrcB [Alphaproteobacteria bacterium]